MSNAAGLEPIMDETALHPKVSIIIPVFNRLDMTRRCLESLVGVTQPGCYELLIVDNGSNDGTGDYLKSLAFPLRIITNPDNLGFAAACNQGAQAASGEYLLFLNNDTEPRPGWLFPLVEILDHDGTAAAVGSKLLYPDGTIQHAGIVIVEDHQSSDLLKAMNAHCGQQADFPPANTPLTVQALTAASILLRKSAFIEVGGFDEKYRNGYEDVDLCFKLRTAGWKLVYQPSSVLLHFESQSGPERFRHAVQNIDRLHSKWLGKIKPDLIINANGAVTGTGSDQAPYHPYFAEKSLAAEVVGNGERMVSIVILTCNQLDYTKECLASINRHTPEPHEIILVDNGSGDGTVQWLREFRKNNKHCILIENAENLGFSRGCNQGIETAGGSHILLLNNDTVVTPGWLSGLLECLDSSPDTGIVGPMTNSISGIQMVPEVEYTDTAGLDGYALEFREKYRGRRIALRRIVGFCMLFRRSLAQRVGLLDERFGSGNFEDDDYCLRAALEGYRNMVSGDVFIHHYGSATFRGNGIDFTKSMTGNRGHFDLKWGGPFTDEALAKKILTLKTLEKAEVYFQKGEPDKGIETILQEGIKLIPSEERFYFYLAEKLIEEKRYHDALGAIGQLPSGNQCGRAAMLSAQACEGTGDSLAAMEFFEKAHALKVYPAAAHNLLGILAFKKGNLEDAEKEFRLATEYDPGIADSFTSLGVLAWSNDRQCEALELLERGFLISPAAPDCAERYHSALRHPEHLQKGINAFREARRLFPQNRRIAYLLTDLLIRSGEIQDALKMIQESIIEFGLPEGLIEASLPLRRIAGPHQPSEDGADATETLSVCMITKNEEANLPRCLAGVLPVADEIIIVDTGSGDKTREISEIFGARVFDFDWDGDFSHARNESLSHASCSWILVMDADEVLSPLDHGKIKALLSGSAGKPVAYAIETRNYTLNVNRENWRPNDGLYPLEQAAGGWVPSVKTRIFPNRMNVRFENPIHEIVELSLERSGISVIDCDIPVHHYGFLDQDRQRAKKLEYYDLGVRKLSENGNDLKAIYELAVQAGELGKHEESIGLWKKALSLNPSMEVAWFNLGYNLLMLDRFGESMKASGKALELNPTHREAITNLAMCELCVGSVDKAISLLQNSLARHPDDPFTVLMLGVAFSCAGKKEAAGEFFDTLRKRQISFSEFINKCSEKLLAAGKDDLALLLDSITDAVAA